MTTINKTIKSPTAPKSTKVLWDNGTDLMINRNGKWEKVNKPMSAEMTERIEALE